METIAKVRRLLAKGTAIKETARRCCVSRNTVRKIRDTEIIEPKYKKREPRPRIIEKYTESLQAKLEADLQGMQSSSPVSRSSTAYLSQCDSEVPVLDKARNCTYIFVMKCEWDEEKNRANKRKHHISFELACKVFDDPHHRTEFDREIDGEERWHALGIVFNLVILMVIHTYRRNGEEEIIRIISARKADARERRQYEEQL